MTTRTSPCTTLAAIAAIGAILGLTTAGVAGCAPADDAVTGDDSNFTAAKRFDPNFPAPVQHDDWSCSVHTTTWMLQASGMNVSWASVSSHMRSANRVSQAVGLHDATGSGVDATLNELADGSPSVGHTGSASFDDVAARAGKMAVGIGGRGWNHWTAVRGYDASRDMLLLANSAPSWMGAGQELDRGEFARLGSFSMVWMDYGDAPKAEPEPPPFTPAKAPEPAQPEGDFPPLLVKVPVGGGGWITQCNEDKSGQRVWQTTDTGPRAEWRWGQSMYPQEIQGECGAPHGDTGTYPLVFLNEAAGDFGAWITHCQGEGGMAAVYMVDGEIDGHPAAPFHHYEPDPDCP